MWTKILSDEKSPFYADVKHETVNSVSLESGKTNWVYQAEIPEWVRNQNYEDPYFGLALLGEDQVIFYEGVVAALDKATGEQLWTQKIEQGPWFDIFAKSDNFLIYEYVSENMSHLTGVDMETGTTLWEITTPVRYRAFGVDRNYWYDAGNYSFPARNFETGETVEKYKISLPRNASISDTFQLINRSLYYLDSTFGSSSETILHIHHFD